jgi:hypothetical protein
MGGTLKLFPKVRRSRLDLRALGDQRERLNRKLS